MRRRAGINLERGTPRSRSIAAAIASCPHPFSSRIACSASLRRCHISAAAARSGEMSIPCGRSLLPPDRSGLCLCESVRVLRCCGEWHPLTARAKMMSASGRKCPPRGRMLGGRPTLCRVVSGSEWATFRTVLGRPDMDRWHPRRIPGPGRVRFWAASVAFGAARRPCHGRAAEQPCPHYHSERLRPHLVKPLRRRRQSAQRHRPARTGTRQYLRPILGSDRSWWTWSR